MEANEFYEKVFKIDSPYKHQLEIWERLTNNEFPLLLRAPTGSGKTEAVLAPFLNQFLERKFTIAPRLIYALPMRVLVNSIADRMRDYVKELNLNISVEVQHGDVPNSPFFIADIVVTTLDQFLYGFARASQQVGYHLDVPAGAIASSLVVFDEAHMYRDGFTFSIMRALMEILYESKIPFVVMTATMPKSLEDSLFENIKIDDKTITTDNFNLKNSASISIREDPLYTEEDGVNIDNELLEDIKKKKTLIVLNQVKRAQKVYDKVKTRLGLSEDEIVLLHSRFTRKDRERHENNALNIIKSENEDPRIVISTQVLEAGMDFSAELLITELAPADAIVQRAGRCARYKGDIGKIIIFSPPNSERSYLPYEEDHMKKTWKWLEEHMNFNIKDFKEVCEFVNEMKYVANDYEATDTLIDLYECVLYSDQKPENIQLREGKPAEVIVVEPVVGRNKKEQLMKALSPDLWKREDWKDNSIQVDIRTLWKWFKPKEGIPIIQWEIIWRYNNEKKKHEFELKNLLENKKSADDEDARIRPFGTYILEKHYYSEDKGVKPDGSICI